MKVTVDRDRCMGHGQCYAYGPDVFEPDDEGFCLVLLADIDDPDLRKQAAEGSEACPESAIVLSDE